MWEKKVGGDPTTSAGAKTQPTPVGKRTLVAQLPYVPAPQAEVPKNRGDASHPPADERPGQVHYQPDKAHKWYYDAVKNEFFDQKTGKPAPKSVHDKLADPEIRRAVDEGMRQLNGEAKK